MATTPTQIRIDSNVKAEATTLFKNLGLDMSSAVNIFLKQCVMQKGLPFSVEIPKYKQQVLDAIEEAVVISKDRSIKGYSSIEELNSALEED